MHTHTRSLLLLAHATAAGGRLKEIPLLTPEVNVKCLWNSFASLRSLDTELGGVRLAATHVYTFWAGIPPDDRCEMAKLINISSTIQVREGGGWVTGAGEAGGV
jgi:hypothetical protein